MKITLLRSPGNELLKSLDLEKRRAEMLEGEIVDVPDKAGESLIEQKIAVAGGVERQVVRAVPGSPALVADADKKKQ